jgi:hypothetical protein
MTRREWEQQAEEYDAKAAEAFESDDEVLYEFYWTKAAGARFAASYGTEPEEEQRPTPTASNHWPPRAK